MSIQTTSTSPLSLPRSSGKEGKGDKVTKEELKGAKVQVKENSVFVDIYVVLMSNMNVRDISREIQSRVSRTISQMIGMDVGGVNIHIMDIDFSA